MAADARARRPGQGALRRPRRSTASSSSGRRPTDHDGALTPLRRVVSAEPVLTRRWRGSPVRSPSATPAPAPTCCGSPCRPATRPPRRSRSPLPHRRAPVPDQEAAARAWAGHDAAEASWATSPTAARPRAVWHAAARGRLAAAAGPRRGRDARRGPGRAAVRARRQGRRPPRRRARRRARPGPPRRAHRGRRPGGALPRLPRRLARRAARWSSAPGPPSFAPVHDLGLLVRLGRRRRPARRAAGALPAHPRDPAPARRPRGRRRCWWAGSRPPPRPPCSPPPAGRARSRRPAPRCASGPRVGVAGAGDLDRERDPHGRGARMPTAVRDAVRTGLASGPVLVQTPRRGYAAALACERCRTPCPVRGLHRSAEPHRAHHAAGLPLVRHAARRRGGCRRAAAPGGCGPRWSATPRTAEELGRAFPNARVRTSAGERVLAEVDDRAAGGRGHARRGARRRRRVRRGRAARRAGCCSPGSTCGPRRRRCAAGATRSAWPARARWPSSSRDPAHPAVQALVRWDQRRVRRARARRAPRRPPAARLPPGHARRLARRVDDAVTLLDLPAGAEVLGPRAPDRRRGRGPAAGPGPASGWTGWWCGCPAGSVRTCRARWASCSGCARRASSTPSACSVDPPGLEPSDGRGLPAPGPARSLDGGVASVSGARDRPHPCGAPRAEHPVAVQPDPAVRRPGAAHAPRARWSTSTRSCAPSSADLTDTMLEAPGAGLAAPQIGVGLRVFTWYVDGEVGHLVNPSLDLSEEQQDGPEGCLSIPGLAFDCRRALSVVATGFDHARRAGAHRGLRTAGPGHPARDRPPRRRPVPRPARPRGAQGRRCGPIRESDWFGLEQPTVKVSPHATRGLGL